MTEALKTEVFGILRPSRRKASPSCKPSRAKLHDKLSRVIARVGERR